ncbi:MAG: hypothetical protein H6766_03510 [Candidatus Peribacteria bacterium]|nr:MAG: hypothetical protein H6766_03510 [Candidatus Peribacteria bacterium]
MLYTAQHTSGCEESTLISEIHATMDELDSLSAAAAVEQSSHYRNTIRNREMSIQDHCASSSDTE